MSKSSMLYYDTIMCGPDNEHEEEQYDIFDFARSHHSWDRTLLKAEQLIYDVLMEQNNCILQAKKDFERNKTYALTLAVNHISLGHELDIDQAYTVLGYDMSPDPKVYNSDELPF